MVEKLSQVGVQQTELSKHLWFSLGQLLLYEDAEKEDVGGEEGSCPADHEITWSDLPMGTLCPNKHMVGRRETGSQRGAAQAMSGGSEFWKQAFDKVKERVGS